MRGNQAESITSLTCLASFRTAKSADLVTANPRGASCGWSLDTREAPALPGPLGIEPKVPDLLAQHVAIRDGVRSGDRDAELGRLAGLELGGRDALGADHRAGLVEGVELQRNSLRGHRRGRLRLR